MAKFLGWIGVIALSIPVLIYRGFALAIMWGWFVVPLGVTAIGNAHALGLSALIGLFTFKLDMDKKSESDDGEHALLKAFARQVLVVIGITISLGIGWLFHSYM